MGTAVTSPHPPDVSRDDAPRQRGVSPTLFMVVGAALTVIAGLILMVVLVGRFFYGPPAAPSPPRGGTACATCPAATSTNR